MNKPHRIFDDISGDLIKIDFNIRITINCFAVMKRRPLSHENVSFQAETAETIERNPVADFYLSLRLRCSNN